MFAISPSELLVTEEDGNIFEVARRAACVWQPVA
jgi:hypothetical protein